MGGNHTSGTPGPTGEARITMYDVGFGDCFLLTLPYTGGPAKQVLIDCGAHQADEDHMLQVAQKVAEDCGGKLDAIVATHRHKDHISAFGMDGPAEVFAGLTPDLVVQPWTEDPQAEETAEGPVADGAMHLSVAEHLGGLAEAQEFAAALVARLEQTGQPLLAASEDVQRNLATIASLNIRNKAAISWLASESRDREYVYAGCQAQKLSALLPGVSVRVLGPPTLRQTQQIRHEATSGGAEFWKLQKAVVQDMHYGAAGGDAEGRLFPHAATLDPAQATPQDRWTIDRLKRVQADNVQWIVRSLDDALNNTSVILLFEVGQHRLLFAGDAQVENWSYALSQEELLRGLETTTLYKVGHHGSGNATPKTLWNLLAGTPRPDGTGPLLSVLSTEENVYNNVPRTSLMAALAKESDLHSSVEMRKQGRPSETYTLK